MTPERIAESRKFIAAFGPKLTHFMGEFAAALDEIERLQANSDNAALEIVQLKQENFDLRASEAYWKSRRETQDAERMALRAQVDEQAQEIERLRRRLDAGEVGRLLGD
jgi:chromosome segregation ATPase